MASRDFHFRDSCDPDKFQQILSGTFHTSSIDVSKTTCIKIKEYIAVLRLVPFLFGRGTEDSLQLVSISILVSFNTIVLSSLLEKVFQDALMRQ